MDDVDDANEKLLRLQREFKTESVKQSASLRDYTRLNSVHVSPLATDSEAQRAGGYRALPTVGSVIEKGFNRLTLGNQPSYSRPIKPPEPSVQAFPVARHRSQAPPVPQHVAYSVSDKCDKMEDPSIHESRHAAIAPTSSKRNKGRSKFMTEMSSKPSAAQQSTVGHSRQQSGFSGRDISGIDSENRAAIAGMSLEEVAAAQDEIRKMLKPEMVEALKRRGAHKSSCTNQSTQPQHSPVSNHNPNPNPNPADNPISSPYPGPSSSTTSNGLKSNPEPSSTYVASSSQNSMAAMAPVSGQTSVSFESDEEWTARVEAVRGLRFSLDGEVVPDTLSGQVEAMLDIPGLVQTVSDGKPSPALDPAMARKTNMGPVGQAVRQAAVSQVAERDYLRSNGDPGSAGYSIREAAALARSTLPAQRTAGLQLLTAVLRRSSQNLAGAWDPPDPLSLTDWPAVWAYALGPEAVLATTLRMGMDDIHLSVVVSAADAMQSALCCQLNEAWAQAAETEWQIQESMATGPVFRKKKRAAIVQSISGAQIWKDNVKGKDFSAAGSHGGNSRDAPEEDGSKSVVQKDADVASKDLAAGLIRMGILSRVRYILEVIQLPAADLSLLFCLMGLSRHSPNAAMAVISCPRLIPVLQERFLHHSETADPWQEQCTEACIRLMATLCSAHRSFAEGVLQRGTFQQAMSHAVLHASLPSSSRQGICVQSLRLWRVCAKYGLCVGALQEYYPTLAFWMLPPSSLHADRDCQLATETYLLLEALTHSLPALRSQPAPAPNSATHNELPWSVMLAMVDAAQHWLTAETVAALLARSSSHGLRAMAAVLHFLASFLHSLSPVTRDTSLPLPPVILQLTTALLSSELLHASWLHRLSSISVGHDDLSRASVTCQLGIVRLMTALNSALSAAPCDTSAALSSHLDCCLSHLADKIGQQLVSQAGGGLRELEIRERGGHSPGLGVGWGGNIWSEKTASWQSKSVLLLSTIQAMGTSGCKAARLEAILTAFLWLGPQHRDMVLQFMDACLLSQPWLQQSSTNKESLKSDLLSHWGRLWLYKKGPSRQNEGSDSAANRSLETVLEGEELQSMAAGSTQLQETGLMAEFTGQLLPLPVQWLLSPLCDPSAGSSVVASGLSLLVAMSRLKEETGSLLPSLTRLSVTHQLQCLSQLFMGDERMYLEDDVRPLIVDMQQLFGCQLADSPPPSESMADSDRVYAEKLVEQFCSDSFGDKLFGCQVASFLCGSIASPLRLATWRALKDANGLELLPAIDDCMGGPSAYLHPPRVSTEELQEYSSSLESGCLDRAGERRAVSFTIAVAHLSHYLFQHTGDGCEEDCAVIKRKLLLPILKSAARGQCSKYVLKALLSWDSAHGNDRTHTIEQRLSVIASTICSSDSDKDLLLKSRLVCS